MDMSVADKRKLETLNGDLGDKSQSAVRLAAARTLVNNLNVEPSGNAAQDIAALFAAINALRIALR
jgi:hypothetical protein